MSFIFTNEHLDAQISTIKKEIRLSMNGVVADSMRQHGLLYPQNYGVDIPRLRTIAAGYPKSHDLAQRLWTLNMREAMILATMLQPAEQFTMAQAMAWLDRCTNIELVEQMNMQLYRHLDFAPELAITCISSNKPYHQIFGYTLALRIAEKLTTSERKQITTKAIEDAATNDVLLAKSIAGCLLRFCRKDETTAKEVFSTLHDFKDATQNSQQLIYQAVKHELIFLGLLEEDF